MAGSEPYALNPPSPVRDCGKATSLSYMNPSRDANLSANAFEDVILSKSKGKKKRLDTSSTLPNTAKLASPEMDAFENVDLHDPRKDDPDYEFIQAADAPHSAYNAQPDHPRKYEKADQHIPHAEDLCGRRNGEKRSLWDRIIGWSRAQYWVW